MTPASRKTVVKYKKASATVKPAKKYIKISQKNAVIILVTALVLLNLLIFSALNQIRQLQNQQNSIIPIGQLQTYHDISIAASGVRVETGYIMGIAPNSEEKIISVNLDITNNSDSGFEFYPTAQTFVRDNQGSQFIMVPVELAKPFEAITIEPGETKTGQLAFLVTNRAVPLFLYVESRQLSAGPFVFKLQ